MKKIFIAVSISALILVALVVAGGGDQKIVYFQDDGSHSVKSIKSTLWGILKESKIVFQTSDFSERYAQWQEGVKIAFDQPILEGDTIGIEKSGKFYFLKLESIDQKKKGIQVRVKSYGSPWKAVRVVDDSLMFRIPIDGFDVMLARSNGNTYVYSDVYWIKPPTEIYGVLFSKEMDSMTEKQLSQAKFLRFPWEADEQPTKPDGARP